MVERTKAVEVLKEVSERDGCQYRLTFDAYQEISAKNASNSVRDLWVRQLMCIRGVSQFKAVQIVERYPTFSSLMAAFNAASCPSTLLVNLNQGENAKNISKLLGGKIYEFFTSSVYPEASVPAKAVTSAKTTVAKVQADTIDVIEL